MAALNNSISDGAHPEADSDLESQLWHAFKIEGSATARGDLFEIHAMYARQIATKHFLDRKSGDLELNDLCQLAYAGLLQALDRFDPSRGIPFRPFARRRISGSILDGLVHVSERREQLAFRQRARKERIASISATDPGELDTSEAMQALIELATGLAIGFMVEGCGLYIDQEETDKRHSPYESLAWKEMAAALRNQIHQLPEQQARVIRYHYIDGLSFDQIANTFGLTRGRISQVHKAAVQALKNQLCARHAFILER